MQNNIPKLIKLNKPLVIFDLETTGLSVIMDRIIMIAYLKIMPSGATHRGEIMLNPEINIPREASEIHGLTDEDVKGQPIFKDKAKEHWEIFNEASHGGFNALNYDLPLLRREFLRAGLDFNYLDEKVIDAKIIYHTMEPRTLSAAYKFYCEKEHVEAHSALADVEATAEIIGQQLKRYDQIRDWAYLYKIHHSAGDRFVDNDRKFYWRDGQAYFTFSKYKDQALSEVVRSDPGFLNWILTADFSDETKEIVRKALEGEMPKKKAKNIFKK